MNKVDAPTFLEIRSRGVHFINSHALYPTLTTANASVIATGHYLGDTGDFSNAILTQRPSPVRKNDRQNTGTLIPFLENNEVLADLNAQLGGNFLNETSLIAIARMHGYNTAVIGKLGPVGVQDVSQVITGPNAQPPETVFIDDSTGTAAGVNISARILSALKNNGLPTAAPNRTNGCRPKEPCDNGYSGDNYHPGTKASNYRQQQYFVDALTKAILPVFANSGKPFVIVFWSRDPDGTHHNQGDSLNKLSPGINGPTSMDSIRNADRNLRQILDSVEHDPSLRANTDIFVTSDHGYATLSRHEVDAAGNVTKSYSAGFVYKDVAGNSEITPGFLPSGFLAIDLAHELALPLYDPDTQFKDGTDVRYASVDPRVPKSTQTVLQHARSGNGLIGGDGKVMNGNDAKVVVAANGGSDLIYVPDGNRALVRRIVAFLCTQDYVDGLFVEDKFGSIGGALPFSAVGLSGAALTIHPSIVVNLKTFYLHKGDISSAVQIADTSLREGQGMHGSFGRDNTYNNMAAFGPDFKNSFVDRMPVSNADIVPTLLEIMGVSAQPKGKLKGRVIHEALSGRSYGKKVTEGQLISRPSDTHKRTIVLYQRVGNVMYFDRGSMKAGSVEPDRKMKLRSAKRP